MEAWIVWIIIAAAMIATEVVCQWVWTLCLAAGCLAAMCAALLDYSIPVQIGLMATVGIAVYFGCMPLMRKWYANASKGHQRDDRTGMDALLGRKATVTEEIRLNELGRARIDGDYWQVRAPGADRVIRRGEQVSVTAYDSIILTVEQISQS